MEKLYTLSKTRPGGDYGSHHELLIAKFRLKLKKVEASGLSWVLKGQSVSHMEVGGIMKTGCASSDG